MRFESCDEIFRVVNVQAFVVEIRTKIPKDYPNFVEDFDIHFSEVVEDLLMIPQVRVHSIILKVFSNIW